MAVALAVEVRRDGPAGIVGAAAARDPVLAFALPTLLPVLLAVLLPLLAVSCGDADPDEDGGGNYLHAPRTDVEVAETESVSVVGLSVQEIERALRGLPVVDPEDPRAASGAARDSGASGAAFAGDGTDGVRANDETTVVVAGGNPPVADPVVVRIVDPERTEVVGVRDVGGTWRISRPLRAGDQLWVRAPGHDVLRRELRDVRVPHRVRLLRTRARALVRVVDDRDGTPMAPRLDVLERVPGAWSEPAAGLPRVPDGRSYRREGPPEGVTVEVPEGMITSVAQRRDGWVFWPWDAPVRNGALTELRGTPWRTHVLSLPEGVRVTLAILPDRTFPGEDPSKAAAIAAEVDLAALHFVEGSVRGGPVAGATHEGGDPSGASRWRLARALPPAPLHVLGWIAPDESAPQGTSSARSSGPQEARAFVVRVSDGAAEIDLRNPPPDMLIEPEPRLDGAPVPPGTVLAAGRWDLVEMARLATHARRLPGVVLVRGDDPWTAVRLARAAWVTMWNPEYGLAVAPVGADGRIDGRTGPCEIVVRTRRRAGQGDEPLAGRVALWPATPGPGAPFCRPAVSALDRSASPDGTVVFRGLPSGFYRYDGTFRQVADRPADATRERALRWPASFRGSVRVDPTNPRVVVEEPMEE